MSLEKIIKGTMVIASIIGVFIFGSGCERYDPIPYGSSDDSTTSSVVDKSFKAPVNPIAVLDSATKPIADEKDIAAIEKELSSEYGTKYDGGGYVYIPTLLWPPGPFTVSELRLLRGDFGGAKMSQSQIAEYIGLERDDFGKYFYEKHYLHAAIIRQLFDKGIDYVKVESYIESYRDERFTQSDVFIMLGLKSDEKIAEHPAKLIGKQIIPPDIAHSYKYYAFFDEYRGYTPEDIRILFDNGIDAATANIYFDENIPLTGKDIVELKKTLRISPERTIALLKEYKSVIIAERRSYILRADSYQDALKAEFSDKVVAFSHALKDIVIAEIPFSQLKHYDKQFSLTSKVMLYESAIKPLVANRDIPKYRAMVTDYLK